MPSTVSELFRDGRLEDSIAAAAALVKASPADLENRWLLAELLILSGETERAEQQLEALVAVEPRALVAVSPVRNLLAADSLRRKFFDEGLAPTILDGAGPGVADYLRAFALLRSGEAAAAGRAVEEAEAKRKPTPGWLNERAFNDLRDCDDITASVFEVLTQSKQYLWVPIASVERLEFQKPKSPLDLIWRQASMVLKSGEESDVHLPAVYGTRHETDSASRLGRRTSWIGGSGDAMVGVGQRVLLVDGRENGEAAEVGLLSIDTLSFE
jgi:type VI secretion system protein ImpE